MISWSTNAYGAALSALLAAVVVGFAARTDRVSAAVAAAVGAAVGPICWNAILHATHASTFFTDAPVKLMPASWQDTGSGVFALAVTVLILGFGPLRSQPAHRAVTLAVIAGVCAFLVDVYLY